MSAYASRCAGEVERWRVERTIKRKWRAERGSKEGKKKKEGQEVD